MKLILFALFMAGGCLLASAQSIVAPTPPATVEHDPAHPAESRENLLDIIHHLYLWYHDQSFFEPDSEIDEITVFFRTITRQLDADDHSQFAEIYFPEIELLVELKRSDYYLSEVDLRVQDKFFKIRRVERVRHLPAALKNHRQTTVNLGELRNWLAARAHRAPPLDDLMRERIRESLLDHQREEIKDASVAHVFYVSPFSAVSNEIWVLHQNTNHLLHFSADMDLSDPQRWNQFHLRLRIHSLDPSGRAELSKDFIGRALFNCVVLGNRIDVSPEQIQPLLNRAADD